MARKGKASGIHSVGGIRGLAVKFVGAESVKRDLARFTPNIQKRLLRQAVASAGRPVMKLVRQYAKQASAQSDRQQGIGASARSIAMKVGTSKKDAGVAYALIGARRGYTEFVAVGQDRRVKAIAIEQVKRGRRNRRRVITSVQFRELKNLGPVARSARLNPKLKANQTRKRIPTRYLHLFEKGSRRSRAAKFMRWAAHNGREESRTKFAANIREGLVREFSKLGQK